VPDLLEPQLRQIIDATGPITLDEILGRVGIPAPTARAGRRPTWIVAGVAASLVILIGIAALYIHSTDSTLRRPVVGTPSTQPTPSSQVESIVNDLAGVLRAQVGSAPKSAAVYTTTRGAAHNDAIRWTTFGEDPKALTYVVVFDINPSSIPSQTEQATSKYTVVVVLVDAASGNADATQYFTTPPNLADLGDPQTVPLISPGRGQ
jgi:hypothetical protein